MCVFVFVCLCLSVYLIFSVLCCGVVVGEEAGGREWLIDRQAGTLGAWGRGANSGRTGEVLVSKGAEGRGEGQQDRQGKAGTGRHMQRNTRRVSVTGTWAI